MDFLILLVEEVVEANTRGGAIFIIHLEYTVVVLKSINDSATYNKMVSSN